MNSGFDGKRVRLDLPLSPPSLFPSIAPIPLSIEGREMGIGILAKSQQTTTVIASPGISLWKSLTFIPVTPPLKGKKAKNVEKAVCSVMGAMYDSP